MSFSVLSCLVECIAEARFGAELRKTRDELAIAEKSRYDIVTEGENSLKKQERKARHTEKNLTARHKRQLKEMRGDLERRQDEDIQARDELDRQGRQKQDKYNDIWSRHT